MNRDCLQLKTTARTAASRAFTLIEILIVIALTAVLFALLLVPLVSALRYTKQAQIVTAAQDAARVTEERITRELGSAIFVFDGTSHPFQTANPVGPGDDKYTNFLDLQILSSTGGSAIAHAYNAKLDFVLPKLNATGATIDPTTGLPITYSQGQSGSAIVSNPSYVFPLAAGTNMVRYFVGLQDPTLSYNNTREGTQVTGAHRSDDNTYVLYRAEFQPYVSVTGGTGVVPNMHLFAIRTDPTSGKVVPEIDDPDFFRYVTSNDVNWLDSGHAAYPAQVSPSLVKDGSVTAPYVNPDGLPDQHNYRVEQWAQISKAVIPGPNIDLLLLPHNSDNTLDYDPSGTFTGIAHSGFAHDPVSGTPGVSYPIVNTSVTFRPATVSGNATPGTTSDYSSQGTVLSDQAGYTYIPTVYTATSQSWSLPFHVGLYPGNYVSPNANALLTMYYDTDQFTAGQTQVGMTGLYLNPGDILEYRHISGDLTPQGTLVYDVTQGFPVTPNTSGGGYKLTGTQYVPMTINPDSGTLMFTAPSLPNGPTDRSTRQWIYKPGTDGNVDLTTSGFTDLAMTTSNPTLSPLTNGSNPDNASGATVTGVDNAHLVPGSVRVYGPETVPGPGQAAGQIVAYTQVNPNSPSAAGAVGEDQYAVDYTRNTLRVQGADPGQAQPANPGPIEVIYDYQANMTLTTPGAAQPVALTDNAYQPMQVKVDYQTRDLIDVSIGVRIYDVSTNRAQVIPAETKIKIGNSNR